MSAEAKYKRFHKDRRSSPGGGDPLDRDTRNGRDSKTKRNQQLIQDSSLSPETPSPEISPRGTAAEFQHSSRQTSSSSKSDSISPRRYQVSTLTKAAAPGRSGSPPSPSKLITGFALPASARIKKRRDFLRAQDRGFRFYTKYFTMYWLRLNVLERPRLGITVSTKVHKRSTRRNRIKRIVREVFRLRLQHLLPEPGDLVVIAKPAVIGCSFQEIEEDLVRSLARLEFSRGRSTASQRSSNRTSQGKHLHNKGMHNKGMHNKGMHRGKASP